MLGAGSRPAHGDSPPGKQPQSRTRFYLIGDTPYSPAERKILEQTLPNAGNEAQFIVHVGDIKSGLETCSNELLMRRLHALGKAPAPLILALGDNEWTDCDRVLAGSFDPIERLQWLRKTIYTRDHGYTLGRGSLRITNQTNNRLLESPVRPAQIETTGLPENLHWTAGAVDFVSLNVAGSGGGLKGTIAPAMMAAHATANRRWLNQAVVRATEARRSVLVIILHAEFKAGKLNRRDFGASPTDRKNVYGWLRSALYRAVCLFPGTVIVLHGDTHRFKHDQPWQKLAGSDLPGRLPDYGAPLEWRRQRMARFTRIRSFGTPATTAYVLISIESVDGQTPTISVEPRFL